MNALPEAPSASSFVLLADHQSRTPASFYSGPPVLHYHSQRCRLLALERDLRSIPALNAIRGNTSINGSAAESEKEIVVEGVDVWVTSDKFLLYVPSSSAGVSIPYPSISLHAIQRLRLPGSAEDTSDVQGLYMQIATSPADGMQIDTEEEEDEGEDYENSITITIIPPNDAAGNEGTSTAESSTAERGIEDLTDKPEETPIQMLYAAVSACSNLHPDPGSDEEGDQMSSLFRSGLVGAGVGDGGLPPPVEGSSGWITAENMHEFFDAEGNWIAGGEEPTLPLGPGAGTVRVREGEGSTEGQAGDDEGENEETKWRRTD